MKGYYNKMMLLTDEEHRVLVKTPATIKRKMMGSKKYKEMRDKKDEQAETPDQN